SAVVGSALGLRAPEKWIFRSLGGRATREGRLACDCGEPSRELFDRDGALAVPVIAVVVVRRRGASTTHRKNHEPNPKPKNPVPHGPRSVARRSLETNLDSSLTRSDFCRVL